MFGVRIIESATCADQVFDYSACRSPSRARRRWARGIKGRVQFTIVPWNYAYKLPDGSMVMHPAMVAQLRRATELPLMANPTQRIQLVVETILP